MITKRISTEPRRALWSIVVLGLALTMVGGTGIFAVFTDRATTAPNSATSGERAKAADIQLAIAAPDVNGGYGCTGFAEDLPNSFFAMSDIQPGDGATRMACVRNVGSAPVTVTLSSIDLVESDQACTGDEQSLDATCGQGDGFGQLAAALTVSAAHEDCATAGSLGSQAAGLTALTTQPIILIGNALAPADKACFEFGLDYPLQTGEETAQLAQSDSVVWRFAFDATTLP